MRRALVLLALVACANPNRYELTPEEKHRLGIDAPTPTRPPGRRAPKEETPAPSPAPSTPTTEIAQPADCAASREIRVREAKENIAFWNAHVKEILPLMKWAKTHRCQLKDTTGSVLVQRSREAGGVRVTVKHGHPDEVICDTAKIPEGVDDELLREMERLDNIAYDEVMFSTVPECDDKEKPSLRVRFSDTALQKAILALP